MTTAAFRVTMWQAKGRPQMLSKLVAEENLDAAVLCAHQWMVWSHAEGRGKRAKFGLYKVETRGENDSWQEVAKGTLADAKKCWTDAHEALVDIKPMVKPLIGQQGTTRQPRRGIGRAATRPKSRLSQFVQNALKPQ